MLPDGGNRLVILGNLMTEGTLETLDPRIRRTRQLMQQALAKLLENKGEGVNYR